MSGRIRRIRGRCHDDVLRVTFGSYNLTKHTFWVTNYQSLPLMWIRGTATSPSQVRLRQKTPWVVLHKSFNQSRTCSKRPNQQSSLKAHTPAPIIKFLYSKISKLYFYFESSNFFVTSVVYTLQSKLV